MSIERYEGFVRVDPDNHLLWLKLGDLYHRASRLDEAMASFEKCAKLSPEDAVCRSRQASVLISQHQFSDAEHRLRVLIDSGESNPELLHNLGLSLFYQRRWQEAQQYFEKARMLGLGAPSNLDYLARSLHQQSRWDEAIQACEDWYKQTGDPAAEGYHALLEMDRGNMAAAEKIAEKVLREAPDNADAAAVAGTGSIERQQMERASGLFERIIKNEPNNPRGWLGRGLVNLYQQLTDEGIRDLEKASELMPHNAGTIVALGWARLANKDPIGAEKTFRHAIDVDRNFAESHGGLATALVYLGKIDEARESIKLATRLNSAGFGAAFAQSMILKLRGQDKQATDIVAHLLEQEPTPGAPPLIEHINVYLTRQGLKNEKGPEAPGSE